MPVEVSGQIVYNPDSKDDEYKIVCKQLEIENEESGTVANDVREWCRKKGSRKTYRIVLAGYYHEHESLKDDGWTVHRWTAHGGYANRGKGKTRGATNRHKETLFLSPHCHSDGLKRFGIEETD